MPLPPSPAAVTTSQHGEGRGVPVLKVGLVFCGEVQDGVEGGVRDVEDERGCDNII
jgi:hypothetical protein